jgi:hypothetical protein
VRRGGRLSIAESASLRNVFSCFRVQAKNVRKGALIDQTALNDP